MMLLLALAAIGVPAYAIAAFNAASFVQFVLAYAVFLWGFECLAQLLSLVANPLLGMLTYLNLWFTAFLFAGAFLPASDVIWPFRALCYALPISWAMPVFSYLEFKTTPTSRARSHATAASR